MKLRSALLAAALLSGLAACNSDVAATDPDAASTQGDKTLADMLADNGELSSAAEALDGAGLDEALDTQPFYTVLAPTNAAFVTFNDAAGDQTGDVSDQRAALAAVMRGHILPGYLNGEDIAAALAANEGSVTTASMSGTPLTFSREGEAIRVTAGDGSTALVQGNGLGGSNGVFLPIDAVLKQL